MNGDGTHKKKRTHEYCNKGATPIEKNVIVVDEFGNEYEATYPKRARGLVKNGRARFIDENKICLACPPDKIEITEDIKMSENINVEATETVEAVETMEIPEAGSEKYTLDYVLEQIEKLRIQITENPDHSLHRLSDAVRSIYLTDSETEETEDSVESRDSSVFSVCEIFRYREETLQKMLAFYEKVYDDLKPKAPVDPQLKVYVDLLNLDKATLPTEFRRRILIQMVEYADQLKTNKVQSDLDNQDINLKKIELLLAHLSECQNDVAATALANELEKLMNN